MRDWDTIHNPITGETIGFLERSPERLLFELTMPRGGKPVVSHRHPGTESFLVRKGVLDLHVDGQLRQLSAGDEFTVHQEFHHPANTSDGDTVVTVTCVPGAFAERGLRGNFGLSRDGGIRADGRPKDLLSMALLSEGGKFQIEGPPRVVWIVLMKMLSLIAIPAGKRKKLETYWPPELEVPWRRTVGNKRVK